ncbi:Tetratricopeptide repeat (TPR)-like superfamily protein [Quillaja saponaria]|uniref:Tetratricopeptide repeat (TPR)-like superfamily protein n=1 Tax=Quillaja saponaria TaxID=32244 RepID=A0AAD7L8P5_QUISA|nr:Tetratricopeptide repeat (TPR)-like superfamily protein [Quillaja saponaria]
MKNKKSLLSEHSNIKDFYAMKAFLIRTGSVPGQKPAITGSPKVSLSRQNSFSGFFAGDKITPSSPRISLHLHSNNREKLPVRGIRRAFSESDVIRSVSEVPVIKGKLQGAGSRNFSTSKQNYAGVWPESGIPIEELGFPDGGIGYGGDHEFPSDNGGNSGDRNKIGAYYQEMLKSNPTDSLLLRNYGKFLHEVENDTVRAEEYYGRAILANPGDGELLSLYGKLIWETEKDENRAKSYFDQAVYASPD